MVGWIRVKVKWIDGVLAGGILLLIMGIGLSMKESGEKVELIKKQGENEVESDKEVVIDVGGAVNQAGVYRLPGGSRVNRALIVAGGLAAKADREWVAMNLNLARELSDGEKIYIPYRNLPAGGAGQGSNIKDQRGVALVLGSQSQLININKATAAELDKLSGIGPALAGRIIDYRLKNGGFKNINELKLVSGIGDKLFEQIKDQVTI